MSDVDEEMRELKRRLRGVRYLMIVPIPVFRDVAGAIWLDRLWARDLLRHLDYLSDVILMCPVRDLPAGGVADTIRLREVPPGLRFLPLPDPPGMLRSVLGLPRLMAASIAAVRQADIVHSGAIGGAIPPGLVINPTAVMMRRPLVIVIESTPWRGDGLSRNWRDRLRGFLSERLARWSARRASLLICTHEGYATDFGAASRGKVMVTPASWIDQADVINPAQAEQAWRAKPDPPRFLLAARLHEGKGIGVALDAMKAADSQGLAVALDIIGDGPMRDAVAAQAAALRTARLRLLDPVPYGRDFMQLIRQYHAVVVPSLTSEQPRILYDAFSQAVPALASDTSGHCESVLPGQTGIRFARNDPVSMLGAMTASRSDDLRQLGMGARDWVCGRTHQAMHLARARVLAADFGKRGAGV